MTELSYPWDGTSTGDAVIAHYDDDEWSDYWSMLLNYDHTLDGVIATNRDEFVDNLEVTNPSSSVLRVGTGIGVVDGKIYTNDAPIDFPGNLTGTYSVVLRKSWAAQTVRAMVLPVAITQSDGVIWDVKLADATFNALGVATITDQRRFVRNAPKMSHRKGGSATVWDTPGTTDYVVPNSMMQFGLRSVTFVAGERDVTHTTTFPRAYLYAPIVHTSIRSLSAWTDTSYNVYAMLVDANASGFTMTILRQSTADGAVTVLYYWMATGEPTH